MAKKINTDLIKSSLVSTAGILIKSRKSPDELLGELFSDVQTQKIYDDGKTFVDLVPKTRIRAIQDEYKLAKKDPNFDLQEFVNRHFYDISTTLHKKDPFVIKEKDSPEKHIHRLWKFLERKNHLDRGSLTALPHPYIVPGGRFSEQFYWDSYFIMLGLAAEGNWKRVEAMLKNCAYMVRKYGYVPTANRTYFLSRSQPPFLVMMVRLMMEHKGKGVLREYLPVLTQEYRFWMRGKTRLAEEDHHAYRRLVQMPDKTLLNRYFDNKVTPRPESLREDKETAQKSHTPDRMFLHLRAGAESGWDFSARWLKESKDIKTIRTADIIPVDLNSLLYILEDTIADGYRANFQPFAARRYRKKAQVRKNAINDYLWSDRKGFFMDYDFREGKRTSVESLAGVFPLYAGIASDIQAEEVAEKLKEDFLKPGGLVTTLIETGQQWDAPNGWAPLQWVAVEGLRRYDYTDLAAEIRDRWLELNEKVFKHSHKMVEKYNVMGGDGLGGGGEYVLQDGFGWTNGVYLAFKKQAEKEELKLKD